MDKNFSIDSLSKIINEVSESSIISYDEIPSYDLFLSQVTSYLNDKFEDEKYTTNIIQNYVKSEVISKPSDGKKRGYSSSHLVQLILISYMRPLFTQEEIKKVFKLAFNQINTSEDDIISWENAYKAFSSFQSEVIKDFSKNEVLNEKLLNNLIDEYNIKGKDEERILVFLIVMSLTAQANVITKVVKKLIENYGD
ncbi:DUF1836 domain-containing protein [Clostridium cylindrosporum]|uniref:DUF1836 domain-containing protein n=1 Tax=Clostridium cylindrosporum DSM 605 TaxID=1121307 RepID=A0A0J8DA45_CLOCY|nr:DUF1836 domain-containing protein [Clostridium cylindrosporum]KMT22722.1 hypothetical protein CLCY_11c00560 [Clostridium cylindrosporum DSM 605]